MYVKALVISDKELEQAAALWRKRLVSLRELAKGWGVSPTTVRSKLMSVQAQPDRPQWLLKGCAWCGGDMHLQDGEYTCQMCGRNKPLGC